MLRVKCEVQIISYMFKFHPLFSEINHLLGKQLLIIYEMLKSLGVQARAGEKRSESSYPTRLSSGSHGLDQSLKGAFKWWSGQREPWRSLIIIVLWCAWKWRNCKIFKDSKDPLNSILQHIIAIYDSVPKK